MRNPKKCQHISNTELFDQRTVHIVVSSSGPSAPPAPVARLSPSTPATAVEVTPPVGSAPHVVLAPVVAVVPAALARRRPHHAGAPTATVKRRPVVVRWWGGREARPTRGVVGRVAAVHGHLHVHVSHVVHRRTVAQKTLVDWKFQRQKSTSYT